MALVPTTRNLCVLVAEGTQEKDLSSEQRAAFRKLYRLDSNLTVAELIAAGEIALISDDEIASFIQHLKTRRINTRSDLDHVAAVLRGVTDQIQKAQIREVLPSVTKTEFFLNDLLRVLDGPSDVVVSSHKCSCGGTCISDNSLCGLIGPHECKRGGLS